MSAKAKRITELQEQIESLEKLRNVLDDATVNQKQAELQRERDALIHTGGGAVVNGNVDTCGGDFAGRDLYKVVLSEKYWRVMHRPPSEDEKEAAQQYLQYLLDRHGYLNFRGLGVSDRIPLKLPLLDVYVPLKARQELPEGETWSRSHLAGRELADENGDAVRMSAPQPVLEILQERSGLVLLGDPGSGKTTFLKYLTLMLASGQSEKIGLGERLPILVPLAAYANALTQGEAKRLDDFIADYFHEEIGSDLQIASMLTEALMAGAALILFDGLDEVKELSLRHVVVDRVTDFYSLHRRAGNKFVLTSRVIGYRDVRPAADGLVEATLVDFDETEITAFITRWVAALEKQAQGETLVALSDAERERSELLEAITHNPGVRRLAANPLLLTILALMKRQGVTLPERRVELYDQYVRTLLSTWNRARSLSAGISLQTPDVVQTIRILAPLALWMHEASPGVGLVRREALRRKLEELFAARGEADPELAARQFLSDVREHAALLLERGPGQYGFIHLTFEEYLASVAIAICGQGNSQPIISQLTTHLGEQTWHEISVLAISYLGVIQQLDSVAGEVVEALAESQKDEAVLLAGEATLDSWPGGVPLKSKEHIVHSLIHTMQSGQVAPILRREAGLLLGQLGWQPDDLDAFLPIPAGNFQFGVKHEKRKITYPYWVAKYPVANLQFKRFMDAGGYYKREFWSKEGWKFREKNDWQQPRYWQSKYANPISPVVGVSWYEAEAYCNWLAFQELSVPIPEGYTVRLPSEEEWERAARGTEGREYPWGNPFNFANANVSKETGSGIGTTAVCTYPQGVSPAGIWDMSGNVWEWNINWGDDKKGYCMLRGGYWNSTLWHAICAYHCWRNPDLRDDDVGFRVVVSCEANKVSAAPL